jgi:hypothetical protein
VSEKDRRAVACNVAEGKSAVSQGSLAYVVSRESERARVLVKSRGSRWIEIWFPMKRLANFRFKNLLQQHPAFERAGGVADPEFFTEANLARWAAMGAGQGLQLR